MTVSNKSHQEEVRDGGKRKRKFKMVAGDVISIRGQVMVYTYIPTGIKRE